MNAVKVRFSKNETGWVSESEGGYVINNVPLTNGLNIDDVVELEEGKRDYPIVGKIKKMNYLSKTAIEYQEIIDYKQIKVEIEKIGGKMEGFFAPSVNKDGKYTKGLAMVASNLDKIAVNKIIKKYGAKIIHHEKRGV